MALSFPGPSHPSSAKFCWFYLLDISCFYPFLPIPTAFILDNFSFPIAQDIGKCQHLRMITLYTISFDSLGFTSIIFPFSLRSAVYIFFFLFQIFENHKLLNKTILFFSLFTEPWGFCKRPIPRVLNRFLAVYTYSFFLLFLGSTVGAHLLQL